MTELEQNAQKEIIASTDAAFMPQSSFDLFKQKLSAYLNELINNDFDKLVFLLYRIDVSESKLKTLLANQTENAGDVIAELMIERQMQKIKTRKQFHQRDDLTTDEERW